jgi:hypothetical protein
MRANDRAIDDKIRMPLFVVFERPMVCALSALGLGRSVVTYVKVLNHLPEIQIHDRIILILFYV